MKRTNFSKQVTLEGNEMEDILEQLKNGLNDDFLRAKVSDYDEDCTPYHYEIWVYKMCTDNVITFWSDEYNSALEPLALKLANLPYDDVWVDFSVVQDSRH